MTTPLYTYKYTPHPLEQGRMLQVIDKGLAWNIFM